MVTAFRYNKGRSRRYIDRGVENRESKMMWKKYTIFRRFKKNQRLQAKQLSKINKSNVKSI